MDTIRFSAVHSWDTPNVLLCILPKAVPSIPLGLLGGIYSPPAAIVPRGEDNFQAFFLQLTLDGHFLQL